MRTEDIKDSSYTRYLGITWLGLGGVVLSYYQTPLWFRVPVFTVFAAVGTLLILASRNSKEPSTGYQEFSENGLLPSTRFGRKRILALNCVFNSSVIFMTSFIGELMVWKSAELAIPGVMMSFSMVALTILLLFDRLAKRFKNTRLYLNPFPGEIGGLIGGEFLLDVPFKENTRIDMVLECICHKAMSPHRPYATFDYVIWQSQSRAYIHSRNNNKQTHAEFIFETPGNLPLNQRPNPPFHFWRLKAKSRWTGRNLNVTWNIPVTKNYDNH